MIANIGSGTGSPGWSRFQAAMFNTINTTQIMEPAIRRNTPP